MERTIKAAITLSLTRQIACPCRIHCNSHESSAKIRKKSGEKQLKSLIQRVIKKAYHLKHEKLQKKKQLLISCEKSTPEFCSSSHDLV